MCVTKTYGAYHTRFGDASSNSNSNSNDPGRHASERGPGPGVGREGSSSSDGSSTRYYDSSHTRNLGLVAEGESVGLDQCLDPTGILLHMASVNCRGPVAVLRISALGLRRMFDLSVLEGG